MKVYESTQKSRQARLDFLRSLPTERTAVKQHILATQHKDPTEAQIDSWIAWIKEECTAIQSVLHTPDVLATQVWTTQEQAKDRLTFLRSLPTERSAVKQHILDTQFQTPTEEQIDSWVEWIKEETAAIHKFLA